MTLLKFRNALIVMGAFLALIWILQIANWADGYRLDGEFGIVPDHLSSLGDIFTAPFLHFSWAHIEGNSIPLFVLGVLAAYRSIPRFLLMSLIVAVTSGLAVWLFQSGNSVTVGASGLIFGYFGYVLVRGFVDRNAVDIVVGLVAGALYWTILTVAIPGTPGVSWIGHVGGLVGGVLAAWLLRAPTPGKLTLRRPRADTGERDGGPASGRRAPSATAARTSGASGTAGTAGTQSVDDMLRELKEQQGL
jgi:membrane associated rhomboid family serine protease